MSYLGLAHQASGNEATQQENLLVPDNQMVFFLPCASGHWHGEETVAEYPGKIINLGPSAHPAKDALQESKSSV